MKELEATGPAWTKRQFWSIHRIAALREKIIEKNDVLIVTAQFISVSVIR